MVTVAGPSPYVPDSWVLMPPELWSGRSTWPGPWMSALTLLSTPLWQHDDDLSGAAVDVDGAPVEGLRVADPAEVDHGPPRDDVVARLHSRRRDRSRPGESPKR